MDSLECDCCFAVGVLYMMGERLAWIALNVTVAFCRCAIHDGGTPGMDSLECDCCFAVGVLYMMGERLAGIALNVTVALL